MGGSFWILNTKDQIAAIMAGGADWGPWVQSIFGILLVVLSIVLAIEGVITIAKPKKSGPSFVGQKYARELVCAKANNSMKSV